MAGIKAAVIGCGGRANGHVSAAGKAEALEITWACDKDKTRAEKAASDWGVRASTDYAEVLADPKVEAVLIVTDVTSHVTIARDAVRAGKHLIVEKPLGDNVAEARDLVAEGEKSGLVAYVSFQMRFHPQYVPLHDAAAKTDPVQIFFGRERGMFLPHFLNPSPFCGIMDSCAHDFDMVAWLMGRPPVAVTAVVRRNTFTRDTGAVDAISALLDFGDGRVGMVVSSMGAKEIGTKCDIVGARGNITRSAAGETSGVYFAEYDSAGKKEAIDLDVSGGVNADVALQEAFAREIREGKPSQAAGLADGLNSLLAGLACVKSSEEGRRVELDELR